jgi:polysaccharide biosynthesis transport protein
VTDALGGAVRLRLNGMLTSRRSNPIQRGIKRRVAGAMRAHAQRLPYVIDLASLGAGLRRRLPLVLTITAGAGLATFVALSLVAPRYSSEAQLAIALMTTSALPGAMDDARLDALTPRIEEEAIHEHVRALTATDLVRQVAGDLQLASRREFNVGPRDLELGVLHMLGLIDPGTSESEEDRLLSQVRKRLEVTTTEGRFISIRFASADPQLAADFANKLAETYRSSLVPAGAGFANAAPIAAHLVSRARPSSVPSAPRRGPYALLAMAAAWVLGMAWVVTRELRAEQSARAAAPGAPASASGGANSVAIWPGAAQDAWFHQVSSIAQVAQRLLARSDLRSGVRSLLAGEAPGHVSAQALALVKEIARAGRQVVLIDWSPHGRGMFQKLRLPPKPGITDLLEGRASFEDVIARLPGSKAHFITSGARLVDPAAALDPDRINLVLDALDEVYDHIVIAADSEAARALFGTMEGRFDTGIALADAGHDSSAGPGRFLEFDVIDIDIIRYEYSELSVALPRRFQLTRARRAA